MLADTWVVVFGDENTGPHSRQHRVDQQEPAGQGPARLPPWARRVQLNGLRLG